MMVKHQSYCTCLLGSVLCLILAVSGCSVKQEKHIDEHGYAPYKIHIEHGWVRKEGIPYVGCVKKFSKNLPSSNFNIQIQKLTEKGDGKYVTLDGYVNETLKRLKENWKAEIVWVKELTVDGIPAKNIMDIQNLTIGDTTREVYGQSIIFAIKGYVYSFGLGSFEEDFSQASAEFEKMVSSFQFQIPEEYIDVHKSILAKINSGDYR